MADSNRKAMSPENAASMRSRIVAWMERLLRCFLVAGGKNEHVKMEEEPPEGGGIIKGWAGGGSDDDGA